MSLYRVSGVVEAPDGTTYRPLFYGDFYAAMRVRDAIRDGAKDRGEALQVSVVGPGGVIHSAIHEELEEAAYVSA